MRYTLKIFFRRCRLTLTLICSCMLIFLLVNDGHSFYQRDKSLKMRLFQKERKKSSCANKKKPMIIYDNFNHFSAKRNHMKMIFPCSNNFVPSDLIEYNSPIHVAIHQPMLPEDSLANLVYANLKLRQLIEKHRSLHQRARRALAGLDVPYLNSQGLSFSKIPSGETSIDKQLRELYRSQQSTIGNPGTSILSNGETGMAFNRRSRKPGSEPLYLTARSSSGKAKQRPLYLVSGPTGGDKSQRFSPAPSSNVCDEKKDKQPQTPENKRIDLPHHKYEKPWIITFLTAHPYEGFFYLFVLCSIIVSVFSIKKS